MAESPKSAELSGEVLFYNKPEPLSLEKHRMLGIKRVERPFKFLAESHVVPITVNEFGVAASSYPIVFAGEAKTPIAVMGGKEKQNVFVSPEGDVDPEAYLPAFVRRYPFAFASEPSGERMIVCIDRAAPMISEGAEVPLFNGEEPSQFTKDAIEFCREFEVCRVTTVNFTNRMNEFDLWENKTVTITPQGPDGQPQEPVKVADYYSISEEKLNALPAEKFNILRQENWHSVIYAHLLSLLLWPKILNRTLNIAAAQQAAANGAAPAR
jgi:hypothetical protein